MTRCVVCGRLPAEPCNEKTHDVHDRLWQDVADRPGRGGGDRVWAAAALRTAARRKKREAA